MNDSIFYGYVLSLLKRITTHNSQYLGIIPALAEIAEAPKKEGKVTNVSLAGEERIWHCSNSPMVRSPKTQWREGEREREKLFPSRAKRSFEGRWEKKKPAAG